MKRRCSFITLFSAPVNSGQNCSKSSARLRDQRRNRISARFSIVHTWINEYTQHRLRLELLFSLFTHTDPERHCRNSYLRGSLFMNSFSEAEREAVYKAIILRRDVRRNFVSTAIPREILLRILTAAHHAGSVGFMQPWDFILIEDRAVRERSWTALFGSAIAAPISMKVRVENCSSRSSSKAFWNPH